MTTRSFSSNATLALFLAAGFAVGGAALSGCESSTPARTTRTGDVKSTPSGTATPPSTPSPASANIARGIAPGVAGEPDMRVRLVPGASSVAISSLVRMVWVGPLGGTPRAPARMTAPVKASLTPAGWELTDASGLVARFDRTTTIGIAGEEGVLGTSAETASGGVVAGGTGSAPVLGRTAAKTPSTAGNAVVINGKPYPGVITLVARNDGSVSTFDVVDRLGLEDYLKGVVAAEMYSGWPLTAYQVQAVAARSYALSERTKARNSGSPFDIEIGNKDQAFTATDNPVVARAVSDTRGVILSWNGSPLRAYFSSTCGGRPASARDTWPTSGEMNYNLAGPVQGSPRDHACQQSPSYRWTATRSKTELIARMKAFGRANGSPLKNITGIDSIRTGGVNGSGRINSFLLVQPGGQTLLLSGEELRRAANWDVSGQPSVTSQTRVNSSDAEVTVSKDRVVFTGRGLGHGVGMCQWCAKGFAEKGENWQSILAKFYPGAKLERVY